MMSHLQLLLLLTVVAHDHDTNAEQHVVDGLYSVLSLLHAAIGDCSSIFSAKLSLSVVECCCS